MRVIGIALAKDAAPEGPVKVSLCTLASGRLVLDGFVDMDGLGMVENLLAATGPWVAGVDAPVERLPLGADADAWHRRADDDAAPVLVHPDHRLLIESDPEGVATRLAGPSASRDDVMSALAEERFAARWGWSLDVSAPLAPLIGAAEDAAGNGYRAVLVAVEAATTWSRLSR